jgi:tetratricopeptide (TPR) repeat protein
MRIRYFVQGDVRKFGDSIKITSRLLDIETGDHLWQDSLKGTMEDIFDIQETVARNVVEGLDVILTKDEEKKLEEKPTENAEAYELYLKGHEYFTRHTRSDFERALGLLEESVRLDPGFAFAHIRIANTSLAYYRLYSRDSQLLTRASEHIESAAKILGESARIYWIRSILALRLGNSEEALQLALRSVELDPEFAQGYDALGHAYQSLGRLEETVGAWERPVQLRENDRNTHFTYLIALSDLGATSRLVTAAGKALPIYERYLRLTPDDLNARVQYATILGWAGEHDRSLTEARGLELTEGLDGFALYNLSCLYLHEGDPTSGIRTLHKSVERGFRNIELFRHDPDLASLRDTPEFEELVRELEEKIAKETNG